MTVEVIDAAHRPWIGASWRGDHPVHGPAVFTPISCSCLAYSNLVSGKDVHKAWREAKKVHAKHVVAMGDQE